MKKQITILEDDHDIREICTYVFTAEGYKVDSHATISSLRASLSVPNIYLLDISLPDGNGMEVCQNLKADPASSEIPIIMMSAHCDMISVRNQCDAENFLAKPFDIGDLVSRAEQLLEDRANID